jgi:hypothetical protein
LIGYYKVVIVKTVAMVFVIMALVVIRSYSNSMELTSMKQMLVFTTEFAINLAFSSWPCSSLQMNTIIWVAVCSFMVAFTSMLASAATVSMLASASIAAIFVVSSITGSNYCFNCFSCC